MKKTETLNVDMPRTLVTLNEKLESRFYQQFLPLVHSKNSYSKRFLDENPYNLRLWKGKNDNDKVVISLQPAATFG